jgi:transposase-like protein
VELQKKAPQTALLLEELGEEILGVYALPEPHRKRMRSTNMRERQNQELKRRTRVVLIFPNAPSCLRSVPALLIETSQRWMERIFQSMEELAAKQTAAQAA